nr:uncharacterized protein LOC126540820 [Dermacentor andersoni]
MPRLLLSNGDRLPHEVIEAVLDCLGVMGCLRGFISAFLVGLSFRVLVGKVLSDPRNITSGVPQGTVLSPFLVNLALAGLATALPADSRYPVCCAIYADNVALRIRGPRRSIAAIRGSLQRAVEVVISFFGGIGLSVSPAKTGALLVHPLASARHGVKQLRFANTTVP